jgi:hypothetical protein
MITDAMLFVHGTGTSGQGAISLAAGVYGDALCAAASQYSNVTLDFGAPGSASSYPYVSQFPSLTEAGYPAAGYSIAEMQASGVPWGLHLQVMSAFNTLGSLAISVNSGSTSDPTYTSNPIAGPRTLTLTQLGVLGACYFIPVDIAQVLRYINFYAALTGSPPSQGTVIAWFGPRVGGTI